MLKRMVIGSALVIATLCPISWAAAQNLSGGGTPATTSPSAGNANDTQSTPPADPWKCLNLWSDPSQPYLDQSIDSCRTAMLAKFKNGYASPQFVNMGIVELREGKLEAAQNDLTLAIAWNDQQSKMEALINLSVVHDKLGDKAAARADLEAITQLHPHDAEDFLSLGSAEDRLGRPDAALVAYTTAINKRPKIKATAYDAIDQRGHVYAELDQFDLAIADFTTAIGMAPGYGAPLNERCWARAAANRDLELGLADCNAALDFATHHGAQFPAWLESRGFLYLREGKFAEALGDFNNALAIKPDLASALYLRGVAKIQSGDIEGGKADVSLAQGMKPDVAVRFTRIGIAP